ncbi:aspartate aminotransferase family protein [Pseudarthrobacter sp. NKDBFgelt]|uniref:aminotransferase family protein n=1 Tax=Pseudarthrobacter sp. NKDBFgelt TaxID=3384443 RepID=UPI0038D4090A
MKSSLINNVLNAELPAIDHAKGVWLWDTTGKSYIDGCSGAVVTTIGHAHPHVIEAITRQAAKVTFTHRGAFTSEATDKLANRLAELTGYKGVWFVNSGSEAVEAAMQFVLQYHRETGQPGRSWFLSMDRGYHGNTLGGLSLSGHARRVVAGALAHDFPALPAAYTYREAAGRTEQDYATDLLAKARSLFEEHGERLAGIVVEPVGGATLGANVPPAGYLAGLRALCDEFGVLMVADEVMTGLGRTGKPLAVDHWGVKPDIVAVGKGLGAGYTPIAAALVSAKVIDTIEKGSGRILGGHTYAGNPLSIATASAVLDVLTGEDLITRGAETSRHLLAGLLALQEKHALIGDVRGLGMQLALEFVEDRETKTTSQPQGALAARIAKAAMGHGAVIYACTGGYNDAVQVAPPLTITTDEVDLLLERIDAALADVSAELGLVGAAS